MSTIFISCKGIGDEDNGGNSNGNSATLTAEHYGFDGANSGKFSSTKAGIVKTTTAGVTILAISGIRDGGKESINIILYGDITAPKTFALGNGSSSGIIIRKDYQNVNDRDLSYSTDNDSPTMTGGGEVKIISVNGNQIEGTFYAVCHNNSSKEAYAEQGKFSGTIN